MILMFRITTLIFCLFSMVVFSQTTPTWSKDIAGIVYKNCTSCHHTGGMAHFPIENYIQAFMSRNSIKYKVENRQMPPWPPELSFSKLAHPRVLSDTEIDKIVKWVEGNAPEGNPNETPPLPNFQNGPVITNPDLVLTIPEYTVSSNQDVYRCFPLKSGLSSTKFLNAFECVPGNIPIVHHVLVFQDTSNKCHQLDANDPSPGYTAFGGVGSNTAQLIGAWVPGSQPMFLPTNFGLKIPKNANIILQIHYPSGVSGKKDATHIRMKLLNSATREVQMTPILNHTTSLVNGPLFIPKNQVKTFRSEFTLPLVNVSVLSVAPHMHLIGSSIKAWGVSNGNTIPLINIPNWDFRWQGAYPFEKIQKIPAGTKLIAEAVYDNTENNLFNPSLPPVDVSLGEGTKDEMLLVYFLYTLYSPGDENIRLDNLVPTATADFNPEKLTTKLSPNPASKEVTLDVDITESGNYTAQLFDNQGKSIHTFSSAFLTNGFQQINYNLSMIPDGFYYIKLTDEKQKFVGYQKLIVQK